MKYYVYEKPGTNNLFIAVQQKPNCTLVKVCDTFDEAKKIKTENNSSAVDISSGAALA